MHGEAEWLAGRYNRGWTPSEFDRRLKKGVGKIQQSLQRLRSSGVEEIFARITPTQELGTEEHYEISLIVLVEPDRSDNINAVRSESRTLAHCIQQSGRIVVVPPPQVELSTNVGYGYLRGWLRFDEVFRDALAAKS